MSRERVILEKRYDDIKLEDVLYAMSISISCICSDGKVTCIKNEGR